MTSESRSEATDELDRIIWRMDQPNESARGSLRVDIVKAAAFLRIYRHMLAQFPEGYDIEGIYGKWKNDLDSAVAICRLSTAPASASSEQGANIVQVLPLKPPPETVTTTTQPDYKQRYMDLLYQVGNIHPGETRHETAKRYILQAERGSDNPESAKSALNPAAAWPFPKKEQK